MFKKKKLNKEEIAKKDPTSIGNLLLVENAITENQLKEAVKFQKENEDLLIGETLVKKGFITKEMLEAFIMKQKIMRSSDRDIFKIINEIRETTQQNFSSVMEEHNNFRQAVVELTEKLSK